MRIRCEGRLWSVWLEDDGTIDTVIAVQPVARPRNTAKNFKMYPSDAHGPYFPSQTVRFDGEYAASYRDSSGCMTKRGLQELGAEAVESYDFERMN